MTLRQAQDISLYKYNVNRTVELGSSVYIIDIDCNKDGVMCISTSRPLINRVYSKTVMFQPYSEGYVAFQGESNGQLQFIYGNKNSVLQQCENTQLYNEPVVLWGENTKMTTDEQLGSSPIFGYSPQGLVVGKSGDILICLWNNEVGTQSLGKVISFRGKSEIFTDKNVPLYLCPTYIAENGNGDICVSDVKAVVVTDAGGMLRFRYQGNSNDSNFDPYGICCDSSCNIIVADMKNNKLHMVNQDGEFLYHITYEEIRMPWALCIDKNDDVYVREWHTDVIKVISR